MTFTSSRLSVSDIYGEEPTRAVPGVNCNEDPVSDINTAKLAKVFISHEMMRVLLELPNDVKITSMHTTRGEDDTGVYMICNRFQEVPEGANAPELSIEDVKTNGLWDTEEN